MQSGWTRSSWIVGLLVVALASLLVGGTTAAQETSAADVEKALMQLEQAWGKALADNDAAVIDGILASDWTFTGTDGDTSTKTESLAEMKTGDYKIESYETGPMKVRVYGDVAVVTGSNTEKSTFKGEDSSGEYRWTDVFVKRDGKWQAVSTHVSKVTQPAM